MSDAPSYDDLDARLTRLERLLDTHGLGIRDNEAASASTEEAALVRLEQATNRLRPFTAELGTRTGTAEWDVADTLAARVLLADLGAAVDACRAVSSGSGARLTRVFADIRDLSKQVNREIERRRGAAGASEDDVAAS